MLAYSYNIKDNPTGYVIFNFISSLNDIVEKITYWIFPKLAASLGLCLS